MAKSQKTLQLPESVIAWLTEYKVNTGAGYTRICLAGICQYLMSSNAQRDWVKSVAGLIENGQVDFKDLAKARAEVEVQIWESMVKVCKGVKKLRELGIYQEAVDRLAIEKERLRGMDGEG